LGWVGRCRGAPEIASNLRCSSGWGSHLFSQRLSFRFMRPVGNWLRTNLLLAIGASFLLMAAFTVQAAAFAIGDRVQANAVLNVRSTPAGTFLGTQPSGALGTIIAGPTNATLNGTLYTWWDVNWANSPQGWVVQDGLTEATPTPPTPTSPSGGTVLSTLTPSLIWSGGSNFSSLQINVSMSPYGGCPGGPNCVFTSAWLSATTTSTTPTPALVSGTNYRWDVTACSGANGTGTCVTSGDAFFSTQAATPVAPTPVSPSGGTVLSTLIPSLIWSGGSNFSSLQINMSKSPYGGCPGGPNCVFTSAWLSATTTSTTPTPALVAGTNYRWDVTACSGANGIGTCVTSGDAFFSTQAAAAPSISGISPNPVIGSASQQTITIIGTNFVNKPTVTLTWTGQPNYTVPSAQVTFISSTQVQMAITTTTTPDTWTVKVTNPDGQSSGQFQFQVVAPTSQPILSVTPANANVSASAGTTSFTVSNTGGGNFNYSAAVSADSTWLTIKSGASGGNSGTISVAYPANVGTQRTGTIVVTAPGATGSPATVSVTQSASNTSQFVAGQRVVASSNVTGPGSDAGGINARDSSLTQVLFLQSGGVHGTLVGNPVFTTAGGVTGNWWNVNWDSGPPDLSGQQTWSTETLLSFAPSAGDTPKPNLSSSFYSPVNGSNAQSQNIFVQSGEAPTANPLASNFSPLALGNCTWYAYGRMLELGANSAQLMALHGNAGDWASEAQQAGILVDANPVKGSIAQLNGNAATGFPAGHVAVVESVNSDGTITVTESSYVADASSSWNFTWRHRTVSPLWFNNFIHVTLVSTRPSAPTLTTPSNGASNVSRTPTFSWTAVTDGGATGGYRIQVATNASDLSNDPDSATCGSTCVVNTTTSATSFFSNSVLSQNTTYFWQVHALGSTLGGVWSAPFSFTTDPTQLTYALIVAVSGSGTVTSLPSVISCPISCNASFASGTQVTLTATAASGWQFNGWGNACSGIGSCIVTMNAAESVTATFTQQTPTCSLSANPSTINLEQKSTLSWTSTNATGGTIAPGIGSVGPSGQTTILPSQTTTYTGTFTGPGGATACSTTVTVNSGSGGGPSIASNKRRRRI